MSCTLYRHLASKALIHQLTQEALLSFKILETEESIAFIAAFASKVLSCFKNGKKILVAGNGGSLCIAEHFAEEMVGRFKKNRPSLPAIALSDASTMSCIANDFGYAYCFSRMVEALGQPDDILILLSTSGNGAPLSNALAAALEKKMSVISLLGQGGGAIQGLAPLEWLAPLSISHSARIQELHLVILHMVTEVVEEAICAAL